MALNDQEIRDLADQMMPLAKSLKQLFRLTGVYLSPWMDHGVKVDFNHNTQQFRYRFSDVDDDAPAIWLGVPRARGSAWNRTIKEPQMLDKEPVSARAFHYPNNSSIPLDIELVEEIEVIEGVSSVHTDDKTWGSEIGVDASVSTEVSASGGGFGVQVEAKVSASISASYKESSGGSEQDQSSQESTERTTRTTDAEFTVPPYTDLDVTVTYDKTSVKVPYVDYLPIDTRIEMAGKMDVYGGWRHETPYEIWSRYYHDWFSNGFFSWNSLYNFVGAYFGNKKGQDSGDFAKGLDITFSTDSRDVQIRELLDEMRSPTGSMSIQRSGYALYDDAGEFSFITNEKPRDDAPAASASTHRRG